MVKIISDSTCDLSPELVKRYEVEILPLHILLGEAEYEDGRDITPDEIFRWSDEHGTTPKTSAPSLETTMDVLRPYTGAGVECVCFCISESMSTCGNMIRMAAEELNAKELVHVVNSENLSTGIGLLVIEAAILAKEGKTADEIVERVEALRPLVRASFVVDTLVYLHRGGRCGGLAAMLGGALKLHPKIVVKDGAMSSTKKYRGNIKSVVLSYTKDMEQELKNAKPDRVFITHTCASSAVVEPVRAYLESLGIFAEILETRAGSVVSSHCGPGTLGVLFIARS